MKMKNLILILAVTIPAKDYAQTAINRSIAVKPGQSVVMHFDYPELIQVTTWDGKEISIEGEVSINVGENDNAFVLETSTDGSRVNIHSKIEGIKDLPQRITVTRDGQKMMFRDKAEWQKYQAQHGRGYSSISWGPEIEIRLKIQVPKNVETNVTSVYGIVEVKAFEGPLTVEATYGGVDAALVERSVGELSAETSYGQIYSNLDTRLGGDKVTSKDFYTFVSAKPGQGPRYSFESKYGNVYLRKAGN